jgi:hypothetical protein
MDPKLDVKVWVEFNGLNAGLNKAHNNETLDSTK